jgi:hypothetical protein
MGRADDLCGFPLFWRRVLLSVTSSTIAATGAPNRLAISSAVSFGLRLRREAGLRRPPPRMRPPPSAATRSGGQRAPARRLPVRLGARRPDDVNLARDQRPYGSHEAGRRGVDAKRAIAGTEMGHWGLAHHTASTGLRTTRAPVAFAHLTIVGKVGTMCPASIARSLPCSPASARRVGHGSTQRARGPLPAWRRS